MSPIKPNTKVPEIEVPTLQKEPWKLSQQQPTQFTMVIFYRGLHCPVCKIYLRELDQKVADFSAKGVSVIAISADSEERAQKSWQEWHLKNITLGYALSIDKAKELGLYISKGIKENEPSMFSEPALFLIRPDQTLYAVSIQSMPFARPDFDDILKAIDFIKEKNYPARGEQ